MSSERNRRAESRWQDKLIAGFWLPFSLLFHLWVYLTPTYEEKWGLSQSSSGRPRSHPSLHYSLPAALAVMCVLGFLLFALKTFPPSASRLLLVLTFGFSFWQFLRPKN